VNLLSNLPMMLWMLSSKRLMKRRKIASKHQLNGYLL
jgi:hypothetical protein